jgi:hypothetical protein
MLAQVVDKAYSATRATNTVSLAQVVEVMGDERLALLACACACACACVCVCLFCFKYYFHFISRVTCACYNLSHSVGLLTFTRMIKLLELEAFIWVIVICCNRIAKS